MFLVKAWLIESFLKIGRYHQQLHKLLEMDILPLDYIMKKFPKVQEPDEIRQIIGRYGFTRKAHMAPIKQLSDGQNFGLFLLG